MEQSYCREMIKNIEELDKKGLLDNQILILFGHCEATERMVDYLLEAGKAIRGIADNNQNKWGMKYREIEVSAPDQILTDSPEKTIIMIASSAYEPMKSQCIRMGYNHVKKMVDYNTFSEFSLEDEVFQNKKGRVLRGYRIWEGIQERHVRSYFILCPYGAMGDVYQALLYLPYFMEQNCIREATIIVQGNACRQTAELFEIGAVEELDKSVIEELVQYILFASPEHVLIAHHNRPYTNRNILLSNHEKINFYDYYRVGVYGLAEGSKPIYPPKRTLGKAYEELVRGKSAILSPYAKSMVMLPMKFWQEKVRQLKLEGWCVYTNVCDQENPIQGTIPLSYPIKDMVEVVEYAGCFVGIRSGLCDVLTIAECKKEIVYPKCSYSTTGMTVKEFFDIDES